MRQLKITKKFTDRDDRSLERYLQEIGKIDMITPQEEIELAIKIKHGDQKALDKLVGANLRFVVSVAKQYKSKELSLGDLIDEGNLGLMKAATRYDETTGFKFISYAVWWIRQSILQAIAEQERLVRVPQNKIGSYNKANKACIAFEQEHEREPSMEELAELLETDEAEVTNLFQNNERHVSLDAPVHGSDDTAMVDTMKSSSFSVDGALMQESMEVEISRTLANLKGLKKAKHVAEVISYYFGVDGYEHLSLEDIADRIGLTKERVRQIKDKGIKILRKSKYKKGLKAYMG